MLPDKLTLTVTMHPNGKVEITGPIANKGVCYMILELAKDAIRDFKVEDQRIVTAAPNVSNLFKKE